MRERGSRGGGGGGGIPATSYPPPSPLPLIPHMKFYTFLQIPNKIAVFGDK